MVLEHGPFWFPSESKACPGPMPVTSKCASSAGVMVGQLGAGLAYFAFAQPQLDGVDGLGAGTLMFV